jgi:hypothetical protein
MGQVLNGERIPRYCFALYFLHSIAIKVEVEEIFVVVVEVALVKKGVVL